MKLARSPLPLILMGLLLMSPAAWAQEPQLIESVRIVGNDYIPKEGIQDEIKDILQPGQPYTPDRSRAAQQAVLAMGYFEDVQITTEAGPRGVVVVVRVVEKQRVQKILFVGNTVVTDAALSDVIFTRVGHVVDDRIIRRDVRRVEDYYARQGYIAHVSKASVGQFGVLTFVIEEARIEDVLIEGLKKTKRIVVERELTIKPGELFQEKLVARDIQKIFNLGIFGNVTSDIRPGVKDPQRGIIVVLGIEEKRTGEASVAAGYSSLDNFVLIINVAENNFRGRAERVAANVELFGRTSYELSFFEPYVEKGGTSLSARVYDTQQRRRFLGGSEIGSGSGSGIGSGSGNGKFDERRTGVTVAVTRPLSPTTRVSVRLRSEVVSSSFFQATRTIGYNSGSVGAAATGRLPISEKQPPQPTNPDLFPEEPEPGGSLGPIVIAAPLHPGGRLTSLQLGWIRDTRNLIANPTGGMYTSLTFEQAGSVLGGNTQFSKLQVEHRYYYKVSNQRDVLAARLMAGTTLGSLPLFESYAVGGANTMRGYQEDRFRGKSMVLLNVEYRRPISDRLTAVVFVDAGDAFGGFFPTVVPGFKIPASDATFRPHVGAGLGIRVVTPVGPIRLDFGWGDQGGQAHFSFGQTF